MHKFTLSPEGEIALDGKKTECVKKYILSSSAEDNGVAELTIVMDVFIGEVASE